MLGSARAGLYAGLDVLGSPCTAVAACLVAARARGGGPHLHPTARTTVAHGRYRGARQTRAGGRGAALPGAAFIGLKQQLRQYDESTVSGEWT
jgi:hypothetical protein